MNPDHPNFYKRKQPSIIFKEKSKTISFEETLSNLIFLLSLEQKLSQRNTHFSLLFPQLEIEPNKEEASLFYTL
jgi:hypothetical protein